MDLLTCITLEAHTWRAYIDELYLDSFACGPQKLSTDIIIKRNAKNVFSDYKIQTKDSCCAAYFLYIFYLTKILQIDFKKAVLHLYYNIYCQKEK